MSAIDQCVREPLPAKNEDGDTDRLIGFRCGRWGVKLMCGTWCLFHVEHRMFFPEVVCFADLEEACAAIIEIDAMSMAFGRNGVTQEECDAVVEIAHRHRGISFRRVNTNKQYAMKHLDVLTLLERLDPKYRNQING